jgi:hypothetical protein
MYRESILYFKTTFHLLSNSLFIVVKGFKVTKGLRNWKRKCLPMGIPIQNTYIYIYSLNFADDQV